MPQEDFALRPEHLRAACNADIFGFETTAELPPLAGHVGQDRAMAAMSFGLEMETKGYNIFAAGPSGTGRSFAALTHAKAASEKRPTPDDWCYVYNFQDARSPVALRLSPGLGPALASDIDELITICRQEIPRAFESEGYEDRKEKETADLQAERNRVLQQLDNEARSEGFMIQPTPMGLVTVPLEDGKPMSREHFEELPEERRKQIDERMEQLRGRVQESLSQARQLERQTRRRTDDLDREVALAAVGERFAEVKQRYADFPAVVTHLERLLQDVVDHQAQFRAAEQLGQEPLPADTLPARYAVNVMVTHEKANGAPVVEENSPTYYNLLGRLEYQPVAGGATTDHTLIKPGALHRANGGCLVLRAADVLTAPFAWDALKRALRSQEATIENIGEQWTPVPAATLRPDPIPLDLKVILIGSPLLYFLLRYYDEDFGKLFKIKADFDVDMDLDEKACQSYAAFVATYCRRHDLRPLDKHAMSLIVDYGRRLAEDQFKLSTRFSDVADLLAEASFWADKDGADVMAAAHVEKAIQHKEYRAERLEDRVNELIARGDLIVDVAGERAGQVNGLAVLDLGDHAFGRPTRITARVSPGRAGVVDIEREARLSGQIHQKAVLILGGYLNGTYGSDTPLSLFATIAFEQSYGSIEGDSASCAELYAILSSLSGAPIRQGIAVTGSVDQYGNVQVIGGVNHKIEGFYTACKLKGLTGDQGCLIPRQNAKNLMLKPEVIQAVADGKFHIWAVSTVDEGIEVLTGVPAGSPDDPKSLHGRVMARLKAFSDALRGTRDERPPTVIEVPPGAGAPRPPRPPTPPREPPTPPPPPIPPV